MTRSYFNATEGAGKKLATNNYTDGADSKHDEVMVLGEQFLASYAAEAGSVSTATANSHLVQIMAGSSLKVYVRRIRVWQQATATAATIARIFVYRLTSAGTGGTVLTPQLLDNSDAASGATAMTLPTAKGTEAATSTKAATAQFIQTIPTGGVGMAPLLCDFDFTILRRKALIIPAGTTNGIAVKNLDAVAGAQVVIDVEFDEAPY